VRSLHESRCVKVNVRQTEALYARPLGDPRLPRILLMAFALSSLWINFA